MAASVRCEEIAKEKLKQLTSDEALKLNITFFPSLKATSTSEYHTILN
jgi:hypothetical protein